MSSLEVRTLQESISERKQVQRSWGSKRKDSNEPAVWGTLKGSGYDWGPRWTEADRGAFRLWQKALLPFPHANVPFYVEETLAHPSLSYSQKHTEVSPEESVPKPDCTRKIGQEWGPWIDRFNSGLEARGPRLCVNKAFFYLLGLCNRKQQSLVQLTKAGGEFILRQPGVDGANGNHGQPNPKLHQAPRFAGLPENLFSLDIYF